MAIRQDPRRDVLLRSLDFAFDKSGWQGSNLLGVIRRVKPAEALARVHGRRSIWEQLLHAAYWKQRVLNLLAGTQRFPRKGSNWPALPESPDAANWKADVQLLRDIHAKLRDTVSELPASWFDQPRNVRLILGAAAHDAYHTGQISAMKKMVAAAGGAR